MVGTQNETFLKAKGSRQKAEGRSRSSLVPYPSAFTLTELLVVITIIGILAALITGAAVNALNKAKQAAITLELQQIGNAMEDLKNDFGAYPPNAMNNGATVVAQTDFVRMFKKAFPRSKEPQDLIAALASRPGALSGPNNYNVTTPQNMDPNSEGGGLTGAEALYFWLGGFSSDPAYPITGPGGPSFSDADGDNDNTLEASDEVLENRKLRYEFDLGRLFPRNPADNSFDDSATGGRFITYSDPRVNPPGTGDTRRINLWLYAPSGSSQPFTYFDTSRHTPEQYDLDMTGLARSKIYALKQFREGVTSDTATENADVRFLEDKKFQLLHCGNDDIWGDQFEKFHLDTVTNDPNAWKTVILSPEGPFLGDVADTVSHFMAGTLEDLQE